MTLGRIVLDIAMAGVVLSLIMIVVVFLTAGVAALATMARAARGDRRGRRHRLEHLSNGCAVGDLIEIDDTLDRIAAQEYGGRHTTSVW